MDTLTVGELAAHLAALDPDLPVGVCHLTSTATSVGVELAGADGPIFARDPDSGQAAAVWLATTDLKHHQELQANRPSSWLHHRTCGCIVEVEVATPRQWSMPACDLHTSAGASRSE